MSEEAKAAFQKFEDSGFLPRMRDLVMRRCAPFFWSRQQDALKPPRLLHNGTICYVDTGSRHIGITADHVYRQYLKDLEEHENVQAQFGGSTIYPEKRLIDRDRELDLATFDVPSIFVSSSKNPRIHHRPDIWPIPPLQQGEVVFFGGMPGALREFKDLATRLDQPFMVSGQIVHDVTKTNIVLHVDFSNMVRTGPEEIDLTENIGGMSGGPVFRVVPTRERLDDPRRGAIELVGIIYEYYESLGGLMARHIRQVNADGTLVRL